MTYDEAKKLLKGRESKKIGNNTYLKKMEPYHGEGKIGVYLHTTSVVVFYEGGATRLNSGGWQTVTTKDRMNKYLPHPWRVVQEKYIWYLWNYETKERRRYTDNMFV